MRCQPHYFERRGEFIKSVAFKPNNGRVLQTAAWLYSFSFLLAFPPSYLQKFCTEMAVFPPQNIYVHVSNFAFCHKGAVCYVNAPSGTKWNCRNNDCGKKGCQPPNHAVNRQKLF